MNLISDYVYISSYIIDTSYPKQARIVINGKAYHVGHIVIKFAKVNSTASQSVFTNQLDTK